MTERESEFLTPWGTPYYGPVEVIGHVATFEHEGRRYPLRPRHALTHGETVTGPPDDYTDQLKEATRN